MFNRHTWVLFLGLLVLSCTNGVMVTTSFSGGGPYYSPPPFPTPNPITNLLGQSLPAVFSSGLGANGLDGPTFMASDGTHLVVSDTVNNRVLIWNEIPLSLDQGADLVLGQSNFSTNTANSGGVSSQSLWQPTGVAIVNGELLVADSMNARVLIWNSFPTVNTQPAAYVVGQSVFTSSGAGTSSTAISASLGALSGEPLGGFYLADIGNSRIMYWSSIPISNNVGAAFEAGQTGFASSTGSTGMNFLHSPWSVVSNGIFLAVADSFNNRVMIYSAPLTANGPFALDVLGQTNSGNNTSGCTSSTLNFPESVAFKGNSLYIADTDNNRVLKWNDISSIPQFNQPADSYFGQGSFTNCTPSTTQTTFNQPVGLFSDFWNNLWVSDSLNNRITINPWL